MPAPKGNQFWKARSTHGRKQIWPDPSALRLACYEYFDWAYDNPLEEAVTYQGQVMPVPLPKMRAMTIGGLCIFLGITHDTWETYRTKEAFSVVAGEIDSIIRTQKFEGAAAGMLNPTLVARDLGLRDDHGHELYGSGGGPIVSVNLTETERIARLAALVDSVEDDE